MRRKSRIDATILHSCLTPFLIYPLNISDQKAPSHVSYFRILYLTLSTVVISYHLFISSCHWSSPLHTGSVTVCPAPVAASHLWVLSLPHIHTNCVQYLTHREELWLLPRSLLFNKNRSSLPCSPYYCIASQMIHLSSTCSWPYTHTAATTWAYGN